MRALSHCDFCGADAVGTFELLPPELEPTEAEQRRVVLCRSCGDRLEDLLEPLLARVGVDSTDDGSRPADTNEGDTADEASPQASTQTGRPSVIDVDEAKTNSGADDPESDDQGADDGDGGITLERSPDPELAESEDPSPESSGTEPNPETDSSPSLADTDSSSSNGPRTGSTTSPPRGYGKVIRLLRNREFPMDRSAVETLAAGAYDLETREVEAIIEYALEDGELAENGNQLVRS